MTTESLTESRLNWIPELSTDEWIAIIVFCAAVWVILRAGWGRSLVHGKWGLMGLRVAAIACVVAILLGPTIVDETPGDSKRPSMVYLFDSSGSMNLGGTRSRWEECWDFRNAGELSAGQALAAQTRTFQFGHRLTPYRDGDGQVSQPDASDSRLADALRQLSAQVDSQSTAGVVLFSDGRVRNSDSVERMAEHFERMKVPIHVVPVGESTGSGDVAIVSLVSEPRVRKFTENQLTLFIRSFGLSGKRTIVRILGRDKIEGSGPVELAEMPVTLADGAQSITLTFRVDDRPENLTIAVDPVDGELTDRNNRIETQIEIDRTKLRVLYIEGDGNAISSLFSSLFGAGSTAGARVGSGSLNVRDALQIDEDIECTVLIQQGASELRRISGASDVSTGFPKTRPELFAYDCVVLSNVGLDALDDDEYQMLAAWIDGRGGGLIINGGSLLHASRWNDTNPIQSMLPMTTNMLAQVYPRSTVVLPQVVKHPIWRLRLEDTPNAELLGQIPPMMVGASGLIPKSTSEVLATTEDGDAVILAQRSGRGRILVSAADLGGRAIADLGANWGPQPERVAGKLWRNLVYWITEGSSIGRRRLVAEADKRFFRPGDPLTIRATVYDEAARKSNQYRIWGMFEPESLDDMSIYSPLLWPDDVVRQSGEVGPRIAWGEELPLSYSDREQQYVTDLMLSETAGSGDSGMRIELTAYSGEESASEGYHGTQVDSTSLMIHVLSDPFEQQNPLPNRELMARIASLSGGQVLTNSDQLSQILSQREEVRGPPKQSQSPAWSRPWLWCLLLGLLTSEWIWRRVSGYA